MPHERHLQHERLVDEYLEPAFVAVLRRSQAELDKPARAFVDECRHAELLRVAREFSSRSSPFLKIHEVRLYPALGKETECFPRFRILLHPEDLDVHAYSVGIIERRERTAPSLAFTLVNHSSELTYTPAWWVPGAHLQTLWGKLRRTPIVATRSERWATHDDDEIEIRRLDAPPESRGHTPRVLVLHGLEGTIRSHYLRGILAQAQAYGWAADVLIFRGCNGEVNHARRMYHSGETTDLDLVVRRLIRENPAQPLVLAGFSLGGNVLLKWLGEQSSMVPEQVRAAAAVSVPFDLERGARNLERGISRVYGLHFLRSLRAKSVAKLARYPDLCDLDALNVIRTLYDFDDAVTAPIHGFADAHDYYSRSSSLQYLAAIQVPTLLLSAFDDPFLPRDVLDTVGIVSRRNRFLTAEFWPNGGHVGFISGFSPFHAHYYAEERVLEFLASRIDRELPIHPR